MLKHSAYKFVLHPTKEQKFLIIKTTVIRALSSTISYRSGKRLTKRPEKGLSYGSYFRC